MACRGLELAVAPPCSACMPPMIARGSKSRSFPNMTPPPPRGGELMNLSYELHDKKGSKIAEGVLNEGVPFFLVLL